MTGEAPITEANIRDNKIPLTRSIKAKEPYISYDAIIENM
jgi:hypothetical protein